MTDRRVLIIGGGIGGLTAALALQQKGIAVAVFEAVPQLAEVGAGVTITPNCCHALNHLLGEAAVEQLCDVPASGAIKHYLTGETLIDTERGDGPKRRYGAHYCQVHRADLHDALAAAVRANDPDCLHVDHRFVSFAQDDAKIMATFENGETAAGEVLIGCDGIRSTVRRQLWGEEDILFTGFVAFRGLVPTAVLDPEFLVPDSAAFAGRGHTFTRYKVRHGELYNFVAFTRREEWAAEGWSVQAELDEMLAEFHDFAPEVQAIMHAVPEGELYKWGLFDRPPLERWTQGRATLLGDAAHPMTPFLAQGAAMAIEDGLILARALEAADDWQQGLECYEQARYERGTYVMSESHVNAERIYKRDPDTLDRNTHRNAESMGLYDYNPVTVAI